MKICIISKPEHAQPHAEALRSLGHSVDVVDPRGSYPLSYDVYVCRLESVNHQSSWDVADLRRDGKKVIFESSKTKILAAIAKIQEDEAMTLKNIEDLTIERKVDLTIRALGVYSPRVTYSNHQIEGLARLGLVKDIELAKNCVKVMSGLNNNSLANPWTQALANESYRAYPCYKRNPANPNGKTPIKLLSTENHSAATMLEATRILGVDLQGSVRREEVTPPPVTERRGHVTRQNPYVPAQPPIKVEEAAIPVQPVVVEVSKPLEEAPKLPTVEVEAPRQANPKADFKEILSMMNEIMLTLNIADLTIIPDPSGPKVQLSQVVIRKVSSVDDLE